MLRQSSKTYTAQYDIRKTEIKIRRNIHWIKNHTDKSPITDTLHFSIHPNIGVEEASVNIIHM